MKVPPPAIPLEIPAATPATKSRATRHGVSIAALSTR